MPLFIFAKIALYILVALLVLDIFIVYQINKNVNATRNISKRLSNGDNNVVQIQVQHNLKSKMHVELIDELPFQFQQRNFKLSETLVPGKECRFRYLLRPVERGEYEFGDVLLFLSSPLGLVKRRLVCANEQTVSVYPSYVHQRKYIIESGLTLSDYGNQKTKVLSASTEFDQIKEYTIGDDNRRINWKASARRSDLMVNMYTDERSQAIYSVIDMGRIMKMPFDGMTLLDYAINAGLMLSYIALYKNDKAGLITFSHKAEKFLLADRKPSQLNLINEALYAQQTQFLDSNFEALLNTVSKQIRTRSLLLLFTNFETLSALQRQLPYLKQLNKRHLLCVVLFKNTGLNALQMQEAQTMQSIYVKTIADDFAFEKKLIVKELSKHGILSIFTEPQSLNTDVINRYLQLKRSKLI